MADLKLPTYGVTRSGGEYQANEAAKQAILAGITGATLDPDAEAKAFAKVKQEYAVFLDAARMGLLTPDEITYATNVERLADGTMASNDAYLRLAAVNESALKRGVAQYRASSIGAGEQGKNTAIDTFVGGMAAQGAVILEGVNSVMEGLGVNPLLRSVGVPAGINPTGAEQMERVTANYRTLFDIPEDPNVRAAATAQHPVATILGMLGGTAATLVANRGYGAGAVGGTALLSKTPTLVTGVAGVTAGAALGWTYDALMGAEDATYLDHGIAAAKGAGAGLIATSLLWGRPMGANVRSILNETQTAAASIPGLGRLMSVSPRLTTGFMLGSAVQGTAMSTSMYMTEGVPADQAILKGLGDGFTWVLGDTMLAGVGATHKWAALAVGAQGKAAQWALDLGLFGGGAIAGASLAASMGGDAKTGAAMGAGVGLGAAVLTHRIGTMRDVLGKDLVERIISGEITGLSQDEATALSKYLLRDIVKDTTDELGDPVLARVAQEAVGSSQSKAAEKLVLSIREREDALARLTAGETMPTDPQAAAAALRLASEIAAARGSLATLQRQSAAEIPSAVVALDEQAAKLAAKGTVISSNRVAPAGASGVKAIIESTVTPGATTKTYPSYETIKTWASGKGWTFGISEVDGKMSYALTNASGTLIAKGTSLSDLINKHRGVFRELLDDTGKFVDEVPQRARVVEVVKKLDGVPSKAPAKRVSPERVTAEAAADGDAFFSPAALKEATAQTDKSRDILVHLSPDDFLAGAEKLERGSDPTKASRVEGVLAANAKFSDLPVLKIRNNGDGTASVVGHEGRHRALALKARGITSIPVVLQSVEGGAGRAIRWGAQRTPGFDRIEGPWPMRLLGESGGTLANPVKDLRNEAGYVGTQLAANVGSTAAGALLGGPIGAALAPYINDEMDRGDAALGGAVAGAFLGWGAMQGIMRGMKSRAIKDVDLDKAALTLMDIPVVQKLDPVEAKKKVGKALVGLTDFLRMPHEEQVAHVIARLKHNAARDFLSDATLKSDKPRDIQQVREELLHRTARTFAVAPLTDDEWTRLHKAFVEAFGGTSRTGTRNTTMTDGQIDAAWRGYLIQAATAPNRRLDRARFNLVDLGRDGTKFGGAMSADELQRIFMAADVVTGPALHKIGGGAVGQQLAGLYKRLSPAGKREKDLAAASRQEAPIVAGDVDRTTKTIAFLRTPEAVRYVAETFMRSSNPAEQNLGRIVADAFDRVRTAEETMIRGQEAGRRRINDIFGTMSTEDELLVRQAVEDPTGALLAQHASTNPAVAKAATEIKAMLAEYRDRIGFKQIAAELGITEEEMLKRLGVTSIDGYFPIVYSQRSVRDALQGKGALDDHLFMPGDHGPMDAAYWRHLRYRTSNGELFARLSPRDEMFLYVHGAERKLALDPLLGALDGKFFTDLSRVYKQPFLSQYMARMIADLAGIPRTSDLMMTSRLKRVGVDIAEWAELHGLSPTGYVRELNERMFFNPNGAKSAASLLRGWAAFSKLGGPSLSALVNIAGAYTNLATHTTLRDLVYHGTPAAIASGIGTLGDSWIPAIRWDANGPKFYRLAIQKGIFSQTSKRIFEELGRADLSAKPGTALSLVATGMAAWAGGAGTGALVDEEQSTTGALVGGGVGLAASLAFPMGLRRGLAVAKAAWMSAFTAAENAARGAADASFAATAARAATGNRAEGAHAVEAAVAGGAAGALYGYSTGEGDGADRLKRAGSYAAGGAITGLTLRGRSPEAIAIEQMTWKKAMRSGATMTPEELQQFYVRLMTDKTMFRFTTSGRSELTRRSFLGNVGTSLQSWNINQAEFLGQHMTKMFDDLSTHGTRGLYEGKVDTTFLKYMIGLTAVSSAMTALAGASDSERGNMYWAARMGLGLIPFFAYNEKAETWSVATGTRAILGPVGSDLLTFGGWVGRAYRNLTALAFDELASARWDEQIDDLLKDLVPALKQMEYGPDKLGRMLYNARLERAAELVQATQGVASAVSNPGTATTSTPPPRPGQRVVLPPYPQQGGGGPLGGDLGGLGGGGLGGL